MMNQRIVNARIVNEGTVTEGDLVIEGERIKGINVPRACRCHRVRRQGCLSHTRHDRRPSALSRAGL